MVFRTCDLAIEIYYTDKRSGTAAADDMNLLYVPHYPREC